MSMLRWKAGGRDKELTACVMSGPGQALTAWNIDAYLRRCCPLKNMWPISFMHRVAISVHDGYAEVSWTISDPTVTVK